MHLLLILLLLALVVGLAVATKRSSLLTVATGVVLVGYVFGHAFWKGHLGPVPVTVDRLLLGMVLLVGIVRYWKGEICWPRPALLDWALAALLVWLSLSAAIFNWGGDAKLPVSPMFRLLFSFWIPAFLYFAIRCSHLTERAVTALLTVLSLLGVYLALTACAEVTQQWWAVFPRYIADPELGTHFGRARGPALNSVSLGIYLSITLWSAWLLRPRLSRGWQLALLGGMALMVLALFFTYTRSVWLGLVLSGLVMLIAQTPAKFRWPVAAGAFVLGMAVAALGWTFVLNLQREDSGQVSGHSVQQRTAFAYVSWQMFKDEPVWGVGFGRFYDKKLPYLSDRSQPFELESLRGLHHHNTFLSLLVETGMVGLALYLVLLGGWIRAGWRLAISEKGSVVSRQIGLLLLASVAVYLPSAMFHDMSHIFQDQWLLFLVAGTCIATAEQSVAGRFAPGRTSTVHFSPFQRTRGTA